MNKILALLSVIILTSSCLNAKVKEYKLQVVKEYPHDKTSYTQGLFFHEGQLYESTGLNGYSTFRKVDLNSGKALKKLSFDKKYFVEGSCTLGDQLYILTWDSKVAFIYDIKTLKYLKTYSYPREGWGLTTDGKSLITSDGSSYIYYMGEDFRQEKRLKVTLNDRPVRFLNELEYIDGKIWANVYTSDLIMIINPSNGKVEGVIDCSNLLPQKYRDSDTDVLNGIAYNPETKKIYLTGKNWKKLYEIKIVSK